MQSNSLFIAPRERHAGSLLISLGLMSLLRQKFEKIAFFRPLVTEKEDPDCLFIKHYFQLEMPKEKMIGLQVSEATQLLSENKKHALYETLVGQFQTLLENYDFVLVHGMELSDHTSGIELDINLALAKHFNSPYVSVLSGQNKQPHDIEKEIEMELHASSELDPFAFFINRAPSCLLESKPSFPKHPNVPIYFLPEIEDLNTPTVKEVSEALNGQFLSSDEAGNNRLVKEPIVAAMTIENYLPRVNEGDLIIVPGDRSDILIASVMSLFARNMPNIAGIMLTGGLIPRPVIMDLITNYHASDLPIVSVETDTYPTAVKAGQVHAKLSTTNPRKTNLALGLFDQWVNREHLMDKLLARTQDRSQDITTPIMFEYGLFEKARAELKTIVLPEATDERILKACDLLLQRKVVNPILLGNPEEILYQANLLGIDIGEAEIINPETSPWLSEFIDDFYAMRKHKGISYDLARDSMTHINYFATMMVHKGYADGMVSGATHTTADTVRPALQIIKTDSKTALVSSVFFMCFETRVLVYGDCAVNQNPTAEELSEIALSSAQTAARFGITPKVALLSYSTGISGHGNEVDKVRQATQLAQQKRPDLIIEGPLQYDAAIDMTVALQKMPESQVAGKATVFIFPDLNTGNNTYKAVQRASGAIAIGPVLQGLRKPINDLSRGCSVADIINTVAITAIQAQTPSETTRSSKGP
ncbi:phosphate acetyltransferase [Hydrogenovibrio sp. 3SP14C1]|uniref:phosphate acetyltransferase n=1 Tax=Hydrogenovibrio sp. 3SP14C1 TaxID=3038774 RepID=UPI0024167677|nr:phosphate acetyltransferase [Hydrogenovibrio sp. 3SP14C1]MDG4813581.1 phosphate acetyltransferase [Hydrogenovibrio sp. 3SP14C1]